MAVSLRRAALALLLAAACGEDGGNEATEPAPEAAPAPTPALKITGVAVDTRARPGGRRPFIAGEPVRIGFAVEGGEGPYQVRVRAMQAGGDAAIDAETEIDADAIADAALGATLEPKAPSGSYRLTVDVTGAGGARGTSEPLELELVGQGAPLADGESAIRVVDAGGRRRASFYAGEIVTIEAGLPEAEDGPALVRLWDPKGQPLAGTTAEVEGGEVSLTLAIPRLARTGRYGVQVDSEDGKRVRALVAIEGPEFPPLDRLTAEELRITAGPDGRDPVGASVERGQTLGIEVRVGGAEKEVEAVARMHAGGGPIEQPLDTAEVTDPAPDARLFVTGRFTVPKEVAPGRHHLEIEVTEGDRVSSIYRELLVR